MAITNVNEHIAQKYYQCECGAIILPGEVYLNVFVIYWDSGKEVLKEKVASCCDPGLTSNVGQPDYVEQN